MKDRFIPHELIRRVIAKRLEPRQLLVLMILVTYGKNGENIFPSEKRIAYDTGYKRRNIINILQELQELKVLIYVGKRGKTKEYRVDIDAVPDKEPYEPSGKAKEKISRQQRCDCCAWPIAQCIC